MRSRRRRLARQRRKFYSNVLYELFGAPDANFRVWGKPIGCFDNAGKLRKEER